MWHWQQIQQFWDFVLYWKRTSSESFVYILEWIKSFGPFSELVVACISQGVEWSTTTHLTNHLVYIYIYILGWFKSFTLFWLCFYSGGYIMRLEHFKPCTVTIVVSSIMVECALMWFERHTDSRASLCLLCFFEFELDFNALEATWNTYE